MIHALHTSPTVRAGDASVNALCDGRGSRLEVHAGDGPAAARSAALLVRESVLDSARRGVPSVALTLDVSSPACGTVLAQLQDLATAGLATVRLRRAGGTVLVELELRSAPTGNGHVPTASATRSTPVRPEEERPAAGTPTGRRDHRPVPSMSAARRAQRRLRAQLAGRVGVCGVGLARAGAGYALRVNVVDAGVDVPAEVDGLPVDVRVTGPLTPLPSGA